MVSDSALYVTTSNWSADYFLFTGGVSGTFSHPTVVGAAQALFDRDWYDLLRGTVLAARSDTYLSHSGIRLSPPLFLSIDHDLS
jgi:hypothetical protein